MLRSALGIIAGVIVSGLLIAVGEAATHVVFPPPAGLDPADPASIRAAMAHMSPGPLMAVLVAWMIGSFGGATLAANIARIGRLSCAVVVGCAVMAAAILNMLTIPHPAWFWIAALLVVVPSAWLAGRLAGRPAVR